MRLTVACLIVMGAGVLVACSGDGGGTGVDADAPVALSLEVTPLTPERAGTTVRYEFRVVGQDRNGDVFGGQCEIATNVGTGTGPISTLAPGANPAATTWAVTCTRDFAVSVPQDIIGTAVIIDGAGRRSNALAFRLGIREGARSSWPQRLPMPADRLQRP
jgi:hypothetical protein